MSRAWLNLSLPGAVSHNSLFLTPQVAVWDFFRHDEEAQRLLDPMARSAAIAAETQLQVRLTLTAG